MYVTARRPQLVRRPIPFLVRRRGMGQACPPGQTLTNMYDGSTKCCGGPTPESDPCSYLNTPGYIATQQQAAADAIAGGAGPNNAPILAALAQYPQNVQTDAIDCVSNPGSTFTDAYGKTVTCPAASTSPVPGINVSIYTPQQIAAMISGQATPSYETPINVAGTKIPATQPGYIPEPLVPVGGTKPTSLPAAVRINKSSFNVGDSWQIVVTGPPNASVTASSTQNGTAVGSQTPMGTIGSSGQLVLTGTMSAAQIGAWSENWQVNGQSAGSISFTVAGSSGSSGGGSGPSSVGPLGFPTGPDLTSMLTGSAFTVGGVSIPVWGLAAAAVAAFFIFGGRK